MKAFNIWFFGVAIAGLMASCGTIKKSEKSDLAVHQVSTSNIDSNTRKLTETKIYGDTLTGTSFLPVFLTGIDSTRSDSVFLESAGIKLKLKVTPKKNAAGTLIGNQVDFNAIAKPMVATTTNEVKQTKVSTTTQTDSTLKIDTKTDAKAGFIVPAWVWLLLIVLVGVVAIAFSIKPLIKKLEENETDSSNT